MTMIFLQGTPNVSYANAKSSQYKKLHNAFKTYKRNLIESSPTIQQELAYFNTHGKFGSDLILSYLRVPMCCSNRECFNATISGGHIQSCEKGKRPIVVVPLCSSCNQNEEIIFKLRPNVPLMHKKMSSYSPQTKPGTFNLYFMQLKEYENKDEYEYEYIEKQKAIKLDYFKNISN